MSLKHFELEGVGRVNIFPANFEEQDFTPCDENGNDLIHSVEGRGRSVYKDSKGNEIKKADVKWKTLVDGQEQIIDTLKPTDLIEKEDIGKIDATKGRNAFEKGVFRKIYNAIPSTEIKKILDEQKAFYFPFVVGTGKVSWEAVLTKYRTEKENFVYALLCFRGNFEEALDNFADEPITIKVKAIPKENAKNVRKVFKKSIQ